MWCGPIDLATIYPVQLRWLQIGYGGPAAREDLMTLKFPAAIKFAALFAAAAIVAISFDVTSASAQARYDRDEDRRSKQHRELARSREFSGHCILVIVRRCGGWRSIGRLRFSRANVG